MAAVAVRERVDGHHPVPEAHRDLVGVVACGDLEPDVVERRAQRDGDRRPGDADVPVGAPVGPGPPPHAAGRS